MACVNCGEVACTVMKDPACNQRAQIRNKRIESMTNIIGILGDMADRGEIAQMCVTMLTMDGQLRVLVPQGADPVHLIGLLDLTQQVCRNMLNPKGGEQKPQPPALKIVT